MGYSCGYQIYTNNSKPEVVMFFNGPEVKLWIGDRYIIGPSEIRLDISIDTAEAIEKHLQEAIRRLKERG